MYRTESYIASFTLVQILSTLSKNKVERTIIDSEIKSILQAHKVLDFTEKDIKDGLSIQAKDREDAFQYIVSQKVKCSVIITANEKDFKPISSVTVIKPSRIRSIS